MPGYKTHDKIGMTIAPVIAATSILYFEKSYQYTMAVVTGFLIATFLFSPDLDLHSRIYLRWGFLRWIWLPYQKLIHHRSWLSHSGPISATIRLLYVSVFILPILYFAQIDLLTLQPYYVIIWVSVSLSDTVHLIADRIWRD